MIAWHRNDLKERMYCPLYEGQKIAMPRYFKNKLYSKKEREDIAMYILDKKAREMVPIFEKMDKKERIAYVEQNELIRLEKIRKSNNDDRLKKIL